MKGASYVVTPKEGKPQVAMLHTIIVCVSTEEVFLNVRFHTGDIEYLENHLPSICLQMQQSVTTVALHNTIAVEAVVVHRLQEPPGHGLVVKYLAAQVTGWFVHCFLGGRIVGIPAF